MRRGLLNGLRMRAARPLERKPAACLATHRQGAAAVAFPPAAVHRRSPPPLSVTPSRAPLFPPVLLAGKLRQEIPTHRPAEGRGKKTRQKINFIRRRRLTPWRSTNPNTPWPAPDAAHWVPAQ